MSNRNREWQPVPFSLLSNKRVNVFQRSSAIFEKYDTSKTYTDIPSHYSI